MSASDIPELREFFRIVGADDSRRLRGFERLLRIADEEFERESAFIGPRISPTNLARNRRAIEHEKRIAELKPTGVVRGAASLESILGVSYCDRPRKEAVL